MLDRPANRAPRVVDQDVDLAVVRQDLRQESITGLHIGYVTTVDMGLTTDCFNLAFGIFQCFQGAATQYDFGAGLSQANSGRKANTCAAPCDDDDFSIDPEPLQTLSDDEVFSEDSFSMTEAPSPDSQDIDGAIGVLSQGAALADNFEEDEVMTTIGVVPSLTPPPSLTPA